VAGTGSTIGDSIADGGADRRWLGLTGLCLSAALVWLAFADFGVAVPTISRDLGGSLSSLQWANNAFSLVTGAIVLATGRFGDLYGRRKMLRIGQSERNVRIQPLRVAAGLFQHAR